MDALVYALAFGDRVRVVTCVATDLCREAIRIHDTSPDVGVAFGRALVGAALMSASFKNPADTLTLQIRTEGPVGYLLARASADGAVYGTMGAPRATSGAATGIDVPGVVGTKGTFTVVRDLGLRDPYVGTVALTTGEIGDDLGAWYEQSEQTRTVVGVGVRADADTLVSAAGGFLVQLLGGLADDEIEELDARLREFASVTGHVADGEDADALVAHLTGGDHRVVATRPIRYDAPYDRETWRARLIGLGPDTVDELLEDDRVTVRCDFTRREYTFTRAELTPASA